MSARPSAWRLRLRKWRGRQDTPTPAEPLGTWQTSGGLGQLRQVRELVTSCVLDQRQPTRDAAVLITDECVTNAVRHGGGGFRLTVHRTQGTLRVEVRDESKRPPEPRTYDPTSEEGRGLVIVERLASRWGSDSIEGNGKVVWFELLLD